MELEGNLLGRLHKIHFFIYYQIIFYMKSIVDHQGPHS